MKLYTLKSTDDALACRQLIRLSNDCASLQWSRTIRDIPDEVLEALETIQSYTETRLGDFCAEGKLIRELSDSEEALWHQCSKHSGTLRRLLGSGVVLAGDEAQTVRETLAEIPKTHFIVEALDSAQSLVLV